jgi:hypothetical protein
MIAIFFCAIRYNFTEYARTRFFVRPAGMAHSRFLVHGDRLFFLGEIRSSVRSRFPIPDVISFFRAGSDLISVRVFVFRCRKRYFLIPIPDSYSISISASNSASGSCSVSGASFSQLRANGSYLQTAPASCLQITRKLQASETDGGRRTIGGRAGARERKEEHKRG